MRFQELELRRPRHRGGCDSPSRGVESPLAAIGSHSDVQRVLVLDCEACYAIKLRGSNQWIRLAPEKVPQVNRAPGLDARVAAMQDNAPVLTIHIRPEPELMSDIRSAPYVAFAISGGCSDSCATHSNTSAILRRKTNAWLARTNRC